MYHDKPRKTRVQSFARALAVLLALAAVVWGITVLDTRVNADLQEQAAAALKQAVMDAVVQCYAVEGKYPQDLDTLEKEYGVQINHQRFIVTYDVFASNQLPDVSVLVK